MSLDFGGESHHQWTCLSRAHCNSMPHLTGARGALQRPLSAAGKMQRCRASLAMVHFMAKGQQWAGYRRAATHQAAVDTISSAGQGSPDLPYSSGRRRSCALTNCCSFIDPCPWDDRAGWPCGFRAVRPAEPPGMTLLRRCVAWNS